MDTALPSRDTSRICQLTPFPSLSLELAVSLPASVFSFGSPESWPEQIRTLKQALKQHPTDLERRFRLAQLLSASDSSEAPAQLEMVIKEASRGLKTSPNNIEHLLKLGTCHERRERPTVAEPFFRRVTQLAPQDYRGWLALGSLQSTRVFTGDGLSKLQGEKAKAFLNDPSPTNIQELAKAFLAEKVAPKQLERIRALSKEASLCFDKAVALAPENPTVYITRAFNQSINSASFWEYVAHPTTEYKFFSAAFFADLRKARLLSSQAPSRLMPLAMLEFIGTLAQSSSAAPASETLSAEYFAKLSPEVKEPILQATTQLNLLLKSNSREKRKEALESLTLFSFFQGDNGAVQRYLGQAQEYGSLNKTSTTLLLAQYIQAKKYSEAEAFLRKAIQANPTLENRRILIRLLDQMKKVAERNVLLEATHKDHPDDTFCLLGQSARWLQEGKAQKATPYLKALHSKFKNTFMRLWIL